MNNYEARDNNGNIIATATTFIELINNAKDSDFEGIGQVYCNGDNESLTVLISGSFTKLYNMAALLAAKINHYGLKIDNGTADRLDFNNIIEYIEELTEYLEQMHDSF